MRHGVKALVCVWAVLAFCGAARCQTIVEVWDAKLRVTRGTLQGVSDSMVTYFDESRAYQALSRDALVRVRVVPKVAAAGTNVAGEDSGVRVQGRDPMGNIAVIRPPAVMAGGRIRLVPKAQPAAVEPEKAKEVKLDGPGWLWLTDGQRLKATFKGPAAGELMSFNSDSLGAFNVPVDKVARFWPMTLVEPLTGAEGQDTLLLANGDRVSGFMESLDEKGFKFKAQGADAPVTLVPAQVAGFLLANPPAAGSLGSVLVTLGSGEILGAASIKVSEEKVSLMVSLIQRAAAGEALEMTLGDVATIDFFGPAGRLVALKDIPWQTVDGADFLGTRNTPVENAMGTLFQAPVAVRYALPAGSARIVFTAGAWYPPGSQDLSKKWTRFDAGLQMGGQKSPVWTGRFEFGKQERVVLEARPGPMDLVLGEGDNGPVLDRLLVSEAYVLVRAAN
jgi:hypothetical protein